MKKRILAVSAHPDDEVLGCGATLARFAREGNECHVLILAEGATSRGDKAPEAWREELAALQAAARAAAEVMGVADVSFGGFPDNRMDTAALLDVVKVVERKIESFRPHLVFTHHSGDLNIDHVITSRAVETATRPIGDSFPEAVFACETLSATEWSFARPREAFTPNHFVGVEETLRLKLEAMKVYGSELRGFPHPRSLDAIEALAGYRGAQSGFRAAEAFCLVRGIT
jgi:LmbE family N-acetylglucosaminyl deacetylase